MTNETLEELKKPKGYELLKKTEEGKEVDDTVVTKEQAFADVISKMPRDENGKISFYTLHNILGYGYMDEKKLNTILKRFVKYPDQLTKAEGYTVALYEMFKTSQDPKRHEETE